MEESAISIPPSIWASINSWFTPTILFIFLNLMIATILFISNLPNHNNQNNKQEDQDEKSQNQNKLPRSQSILQSFKSFHFYPHKSQQQPQQLQQQESLEIAATQYVFNHPFPHQQDLQPLSSNPKGSHLDPTRFDNTHHEQDLQPLSTKPKKTNLDPTGFDNNHHEQDLQSLSTKTKKSDLGPTNEVKHVKAQTHFVFDNHTVEKVTTHYDFDPTRPENENPNEEENDDLRSLDEVYSIITGGHVNRTKSDTLPASGEVPVKLPAKMKKSASLKSAFSHFEEDKIVEARRPATVRERRAAADDDVEVDAKADDFINKFKHQLKLQRLDSIIRYKDMVNRGSEK